MPHTAVALLFRCDTFNPCEVCASSIRVWHFRLCSRQCTRWGLAVVLFISCAVKGCVLCCEFCPVHSGMCPLSAFGAVYYTISVYVFCTRAWVAQEWVVSTWCIFVFLLVLMPYLSPPVRALIDSCRERIKLFLSLVNVDVEVWGVHDVAFQVLSLPRANSWPPSLLGHSISRRF